MDPTEEQMNEPGYQVRLNDKGKWWSVNGIDWYPLTETFHASIEADKELWSMLSVIALAPTERERLGLAQEAKTALLAWRDKGKHGDKRMNCTCRIRKEGCNNCPSWKWWLRKVIK